MATTELEIVSPERLLLSRPVEMVVMPGLEGDLAATPEHAPMIVVLRGGVVTLYEGGRPTDRLYVAGGFAEITAGALHRPGRRGAAGGRHRPRRGAGAPGRGAAAVGRGGQAGRRRDRGGAGPAAGRRAPWWRRRAESGGSAPEPPAGEGVAFPRTPIHQGAAPPGPGVGRFARQPEDDLSTRRAKHLPGSGAPRPQRRSRRQGLLVEGPGGEASRRRSFPLPRPPHLRLFARPEFPAP